MEHPESNAIERGRVAYARRAWADAFDLLSQADEARPLALDDLERLAWAAALTGRNATLVELLERAHGVASRAGEPSRAARFAFWAGMRLLASGEMARGSGWLGRAQRIVEAEGDDCVERGYLLLPAARRQLMSGDPPGAYELARQAAEAGDKFEERDLVALARTLQGQSLVQTGDVHGGIALLDEVMLGASGDELTPLVTGLVYCSVIASCQRVYALDRARQWTDVLDRWCTAQPQLVSFAGSCLVHRSEIFQLGGNWGDAIAEAERACADDTGLVDHDAVADAHYQAGEIHRLRGELDLAQTAYRRASDLGREPQPGLGLLRLIQGRATDAAGAIRRVLDSTRAPLTRARFLPACVEIMLAAGEPEAARAAADELDALAATIDNDVVRAIADHARGMLDLAGGDPRAAVAPMRRAFTTWQRLEAPYLAARARARLAQAYAELGDADGATLEREAAREVFESLGAVPDLRALETPAAKPEPSHPLTPRELEVLRLVATGKTNRAIAAELGVSEKTIDRHVSNMFTKLDVSSRTAATAYAYQNALI